MWGSLRLTPITATLSVHFSMKAMVGGYITSVDRLCIAMK